MTIRPGIERLVIAGVIGSSAGLVTYVGLRGLGLQLLLAAPLVVMPGAVGIIWLARRLPVTLDGIRLRSPWLTTVWLLLSLVALVQTARVSSFMLDSAKPQHSLLPGNKWLVEHSCLTAYSESARLIGEGEKNIYNAGLYYHRKLDIFSVDPYHYPPPFLLLPLGVRAVVGGDFLSMRALWFGVSALALMIAFGLVAYRLEPEAQMRAIGMAPLIWCSIPVQSVLQMSNFQILAVSISALAITAFPRRYTVGGALLAMSAVTKIFPGILVVYLIARRRWREVAWTAGFAVCFCVLAFIVVGPIPFQMFIEYELPRLSSGEAFSSPLSKASTVASNIAPFGIPLKLGWLGWSYLVNLCTGHFHTMPAGRAGVQGLMLEIGRIVSMIYLLAVVGLAFWSARRPPRSNTESVSIWLALLSLGMLASPFASANNALISLVWLVCINREIFHPAAAVFIWLITSAPFLISRDSLFLLQLICYLPAQVLAVGVPVVVLLRAGVKHSDEQVQEDLSHRGS